MAGRDTSRAHRGHRSPDRSPGHQQTPPLLYRDFFPARLKKGMGVVTKPVYETFDVVMVRVNEWLNNYPNVKVKTCESLEKRCHYSHGADPNDSIRYENDSTRPYMLRGFRLWYCLDPTSTRQQLGYLNWIPEGSKTMTGSDFESLHSSLTKLNAYLKQRPLPGRIITIETQDIKHSDSFFSEGLQPDKSLWHDSGKGKRFFVFVMRIFYIVGPPQSEAVGVADFTPRVDDVKGAVGSVFFTPPNSEPFHSVMSRAHAWIKNQQGFRITNVQTINIKVRSTSGRVSLDTQRTSYSEVSRGMTIFARCVRVAYVIPQNPPPPSKPLLLTYKTIIPALVKKQGSAAYSEPKFETQQQALGRAIAWLNATGATVLCAETVDVKSSQHGKMVEDENTVDYDPSQNLSVYYVGVLRLYLHGFYQEPPPEVLPVVPEPAKSSDCLLM